MDLFLFKTKLYAILYEQYCFIHKYTNMLYKNTILYRIQIQHTILNHAYNAFIYTPLSTYMEYNAMRHRPLEPTL
jgi:hypothetical protein